MELAITIITVCEIFSHGSFHSVSFYFDKVMFKPNVNLRD